AITPCRPASLHVARSPFRGSPQSARLATPCPLWPNSPVVHGEREACGSESAPRSLAWMWLLSSIGTRIVTSSDKGSSVPPPHRATRESGHAIAIVPEKLPRFRNFSKRPEIKSRDTSIIGRRTLEPFHTCVHARCHGVPAVEAPEPRFLEVVT